MAGMDALNTGFVSRLYDSAELALTSGAMPCWSNGSTQCSAAARRPVTATAAKSAAVRWRDRNHPDLHLRRSTIVGGLGVPTAGRSRRRPQPRPSIAGGRHQFALPMGVDSSRSAASGVPRNPIWPVRPRRGRLGLSDEQMGLLFAAIVRAAHLTPTPNATTP